MLQSLPTNQTLRTEYDASRKDIDHKSEFNIAMMYSRAVEYWLDCVGLGYGLTYHQDGIAHVPFDPDQEIALSFELQTCPPSSARPVGYLQSMDIPITRCGKKEAVKSHLYHKCALPSTELRVLNSVRIAGFWSRRC